MLYLSSFRRGAIVDHYAAMFYNGTIDYNVGTDDTPLWREPLKGEIHTSASNVAHGFNNCVHYEAYGEVNLPSYDAAGEEISSKGYEIHASASKSIKDTWYRATSLVGIVLCADFACTVGSFYEGFISVFLLGEQAGKKRPIAESWLPYGFTDRYGYHSRREAVDRIDGLTYRQFQNLVYYNYGARVVQKPNRKNQAIEYIKNANQAVLDELQPDACLSRNRELVFKECLNSIQDIQTAGIAADVAIDGLLLQAIPEAVNALRKVWLNTGSERLKNLANLDLAVNYGVLAPYRDYMDFFQSIARYYKTGLKPFYKTGKAASHAFEKSNWKYRITTGIQYDPLRASHFEDIFGIFYQAGFGISFAKVWDLVPFSFAVDWLVNIQSVLEQLDAIVSTQRYPIKYCWNTIRAEREMDSPFGPYSVIYYKRIALRHLPSIKVSFDTKGLKGTLSTHNASEALSLLLQLIL